MISTKVIDGTISGSIHSDRSLNSEFQGNVKAVDAYDLLSVADVLTVNQVYQHDHNAGAYYETGERLGRDDELLMNEKGGSSK